MFVIGFDGVIWEIIDCGCEVGMLLIFDKFVWMGVCGEFDVVELLILLLIWILIVIG